MIVTLPDNVTEALALPPPEREHRLMVELACAMFANETLTFGLAAELAAMDQAAFGRELGRRGIARAYTIEDAGHDRDAVLNHERNTGL